MLKQRGLDVNWGEPEIGITAAHISAQGGHDKCLALLSQYAGADLSKMNKRGYASIHLACSFGRHACIDVLLSCGVSANLPTAKETTPAMICCMNGHVKCLALLSDKGADLSAVNKLGLTAAHFACQAGVVKCLQLLISRGVSVNEVDVNGLTPLDCARMYKQPESVDLLIASGALGKNVEDLPPVSEADKVRNAASFSAFVSRVFTRLLPLLSHPVSFTSSSDTSHSSHSVIFLYCVILSSRKFSPNSPKKQRLDRGKSDYASTRRARSRRRTGRPFSSVPGADRRCTAARTTPYYIGPSTRVFAKS